MYVTNAFSATITVIDKKNVVIDTIAAGSVPAGMTFYAGCGNMNVSNSPSYTVRVIGIISPIPILEGLLTSGNNVCWQSSDGNRYSESPIYQGQSTEEDSSVVS